MKIIFILETFFFLKLAIEFFKIINYSLFLLIEQVQENDKNAKGTRKPLPRLFDLERIKEIGGEVTTDGDFIVFEGNHYRAGLLYRSFYINAIIVDGVKPSFIELEKFQESADGLQKEC